MSEQEKLVPPPLPPAADLPAPTSNVPATDPLQFETAEYEHSAGVRCGSCHKSIAVEYYETAGATICTDCRNMLVVPQGRRLTRVARAVGAGSLAALAGCLLHYLVGRLTGYEFGLIAIVVGFAVGGAVKWGSYGRGGPRYQALAIVLTYVAIISTQVPAIFNLLISPPAGEEATAASSSGAAVSDTTRDAPPPGGTTADEEVSLGAALLGVVILATMVMGIAMAAPFLAGFENVLGIIIIGIGVYEAWKINRRPAITGPHQIADAGQGMMTP